MKTPSVVLASLALLLAAFVPDVTAQVVSPIKLGRGVNFGNMLEAPHEGAWGLKADVGWFKKVKEAGFDHVRLPISWGYHTEKSPPFKIEERFFSRVETLANACLRADLKLLINCHHDPSLNEEPLADRDRFLAMWHQISERFADLPNESVAFELLNEPHGKLGQTPATWDAMVVDAIRVVRRTNPHRTIVIGPVDYNAIGSLHKLTLPNDPLIVVTVHYYLPFDFTHQGASWVSPMKPTGVAWVPESLRIAGGWKNESWNTKIEGSESGLSVDYEAGWAGVKLRASSDVNVPQAFVIHTDRSIKLRLALVPAKRSSDDGDDPEPIFAKVIKTEAGKPIRVALPQSLPGQSFTTIYLQSQSDQPTAPFRIAALELVYDGRSQSLLSTAAEAIHHDLSRAANWGKQYKRRIYLGEFGAYQAGDLRSRVRWTASVREAAESLDLDWCYWELAAGFGIFDPQTETFHKPLVEALIP
ncbi:glycoside hydrolase family 5 protein [Roseiconus lacunae]|uniref:glycoside hydrolase family 5 protein n=1 Tax=Roseiconus lacunae TaxID=2605694 RepID=UPI00308F4EAF|nr:glycoside hydrolase family 5 protein [Stieleria sp. HD01]